MVNVKEFFKDKTESMYALVTYGGSTYPIYFANAGGWFLESPCELYLLKEFKDKQDADEFCKAVAEEEVEDSAYVMPYIEKFMKPMIVNNRFYEIENFQVAPYLPEFVENIVEVAERDCLLFMLKYDENVLL